MKTKQELEKAIVDTQRMYKYNIIGNDTHICIQNKKIIERTFKTRLMENTIRKLTQDSLSKRIVVDDNHMMIYKRRGEILGPEADYSYYKEKF